MDGDPQTGMISGFRHKGLERFFKTGDHRGVPAQHAARIERMSDRLDGALHPGDMNLPGRPVSTP